MENKYTIYHPQGGVMNHFCHIGQFDYVAVATVIAANVEHAFERGQNDMNEEYASAYKIRSTSVGDIIKEENTSIYYMVHGLGMQEIDESALCIKPDHPEPNEPESYEYNGRD